MAEVMVDEYGRPEPRHEGGEVATLLGFLDYQRATLEWKCRGLSDEQLRVALRPSSMTLGGLLKHLACVEDSWFTEVVAGEPFPNHGPVWTFRRTRSGPGTAQRSTPASTCGLCGRNGLTGPVPSCRHSSAGMKRRR